jgi:hypothetical protein
MGQSRNAELHIRYKLGYSMLMCVLCGSPLPEGKIYRADLCSCGKALHSCRNCKFYARGRQYDCSEHISEQVTDKEAANYCDYFSPNRSLLKGAGQTKADEARSTFDKLFG